MKWRALLGRLGGQWERDRRDTLFLLGAILCAVLPHLGHLPLWTSGLFLLFFVWRLRLTLTGKLPPPRWVQITAALACTAAIYIEFKTLIGRDSGVSLLVLYLGLKLMEVRARRDLFVVLFLCLFLLITGFFYSQGAQVIVMELVAVIALTAAMITMHYGNTEASIAKRLRLSAIIALQALPVAAVLFVLFPRLQNPLWTMPEERRAGKTGLSESMSAGSIGELLESNELVFRAQFQTTAPDKKQLYWRGPILGSFDGKTWRPPTYPVARAPKVQVAHGPSPAVRYTVTLEPQDNDWIYALDMITSVPKLADTVVKTTPEVQLVAPGTAGQRVRYDAESVLEYTLGANDERIQQQNWLDLPASFNPRTLALAQEWARQEPDHEKLVQRALTKFSTEPFFYSLKPPVLGRDSVDEFLFDTKRGFCEHYSNAFVVLMRAMDIPARVATGYQGGERNPVDGIFTVRAADAHAWAEVWLTGRGWVRVDPTAAVAPERVEQSVRQARAQRERSEKAPEGWREHWRFQLDAWSNTWNQWVLNYDQKRQKQLLAKIGLRFDDWTELLGIMAIFLVAVLAAIAALTLRPRRPKDPLERSYQQLLHKLERLGVNRQNRDTPLSLQMRALPLLPQQRDREGLERIVRRYNKLRYDVGSPSRSEIRALDQLIASWKISH